MKTLITVLVIFLVGFTFGATTLDLIDKPKLLAIKRQGNTLMLKFKRNPRSFFDKQMEFTIPDWKQVCWVCDMVEVKGATVPDGQYERCQQISPPGCKTIQRYMNYGDGTSDKEKAYDALEKKNGKLLHL